MKTHYLILFITSLAFVISIKVIPKVIKWVNKKGLLAQPNHRTSHIIPTPTMGGIGIFLGLLSVIPFLNFNVEIFTVMFTMTILFVAGFWDDSYNMKSLVKLSIQLICATLLYYAGFKIDHLHGIFGINEIPEIISFIVTILFITAVTNAFNLIDGIDGLAGGVSLINTLFFGSIFLLNNQYDYAFIAFALSGALLGFLKYNFSPAKIFMGDTGSLFLGLIMSIFVIKTFQTNVTTELSISSSIVLIFLPVFDTVRLFTHRILKKKSPFTADKNHLHHLVLRLLHSHAKATITICVLHTGLLGMIFLGNYLSPNLLLTILMCLLTLIVALFIVVVVILSLNQQIQKIKYANKLITSKNKLLEKI